MKRECPSPLISGEEKKQKTSFTEEDAAFLFREWERMKNLDPPYNMREAEQDRVIECARRWEGFRDYELLDAHECEVELGSPESVPVFTTDKQAECEGFVIYFHEKTAIVDADEKTAIKV
jgi:hypothetical protein